MKISKPIFKVAVKGAYAVLSALLFMSLFVSCNPHEFPSGNGLAPSVTLNLHFNRDFPIYREISYPDARSPHDIEMEYTVWGWDCSDGDENVSNREPDMKLQWTGDITDPDCSYVINDIHPGAWKFIAWAHISDAETHTPLAYSVDSHTSIKLKIEDDGEFKAIPWNDAFRGEAHTALCCSEQREIQLEMSRPVGGFEFLSTDIDKFIEDELTRRGASGKGGPADAPNKVINLNEYTVGYHIQGYYPTEFDNTKNLPVDAKTGLYGRGRISDNGDGTGTLGGCMMLVNGHETVVTVVVRIYDRQGAVATSAPIDVPVVRGKLTLIRGEFLTVNSGAGLGIVPDFDGEYNYPVY